MKKLNKENRLLIARAVLAHAFNDRIDAVLLEEASIQAEILNRLYPPAVRKHMTALIEFSTTMPFDTFSHLTVAVAGKRMPVGSVREYYDPKSTKVQFEDMVSHLRVVARRRASAERNTRIPVLCNNHSASSEIITVDDQDALGKRVEAYWDERYAIAEAMTQQRAQIIGILAHIKTDVQLKAKWPEVMTIADQFLAEVEEVPANLPAIPTAELNATLGLPAPANNDTLELTEIAA